MSKMPVPSDRSPTLRHLEQLMAGLLDGVILMDPTGAILSANDAALHMHGVQTLAELGETAEDYAARFSMWDAEGKALRHRDYPLFRLLAGESFPDLTVAVAPVGEGEARWVHQVRDVVMDENGGDPDCLALVLCDVSARFDAEARFDAMFRANPAPALVLRLDDQRILRANPGFLSLTGFTSEQLVGRTLFGLDLLAGLRDASAVRARIEKGEAVSQTEAELLVADGSRRLVIFAAQPIDVTQEDALLLTFADLEPRRLAERALASSEQHFSTVFEMAPVAMMVTRDADRIASVNAAFLQLTARTPEEAHGRTADELQLWASADDRAAAEQEVQARGGFRNRDGRLSVSDGTMVDCLVSAQTIDVRGEPAVLWLYQDITARRRSELELVEAIDAVMKEASWLSRSIIDKLATLRRPGPHLATVDLSPREREILALICGDLDDTVIADRLGLSRNTVRNHVARIYAKIGVNRRSGAVIWGRERGLTVQER